MLELLVQSFRRCAHPVSNVFFDKLFWCLPNTTSRSLLCARFAKYRLSHILEYPRLFNFNNYFMHHTINSICWVCFCESVFSHLKQFYGDFYILWLACAGIINNLNKCCQNSNSAFLFISLATYVAGNAKNVCLTYNIVFKCPWHLVWFSNIVL